MTKTEYFNKNVSPAMADVLLTIDTVPTDLYTTLHYWLIDDPAHCDIEECESIIALQPGKSVYCSMAEVKQIA